MKHRLLYLFLVILFSTQSSFAQEITMFPGFWGTKYYQDDNNISKREVASLMMQDPEAGKLWQKSNTHNTIGWVAFGAEVGFLIWQLKRGSDGKSQTGPLIGVLGTAAIAIGFSLSSSSLKKKAILKYNKNLDLGSILNFGPTYNGLGLVLQF